MIYNFEPNDKSWRQFLETLDSCQIDYDLIRRDRVVVRIFGQIDAELKSRLDKIGGEQKRLTLKKQGDDSPRVEGRVQESVMPDSEGVMPLSKGAMPLIMAGPCSVESVEQLDETARFLSGLGVKYLRGGAFKPRTRSDSFQGLGRAGLKILSDVAAKYDMKVVTELMDRSQLNDVCDHADLIQVGSRNMFNYSLLTALGAIDKPIVLKRGMAAEIDEWAHAADYIRRGGNENIILCERGIRTFEKRTRFTLDILAVPIARRLTGLPVMVDASHPAGERELVPILVAAALAAGADGIMVEVHPRPDEALSDGSQALDFESFEKMLADLTRRGLLPANARTGHTVF